MATASEAVGAAGNHRGSVAADNDAVQFPDIEQLSQEGAIVLREKFAIEKIESAEHYQSICQLVLDAAANVKSMEAHVEPAKAAAYSRWKKMCDVLKEKTQPWVDIIAKGKPLIANYQTEQERLRKVEEEAERKRQMELQQQQNAAQAEQLASEGRVEEGVALLESEPMTPVVSTSRPVPKVSGIGGTKIVYSAEVFDLKALVKAVVEGEAPLQYVVADQKMLDGQAALFRESFSVAGVRLKKETKLTSVRSR